MQAEAKNQAFKDTIMRTPHYLLKNKTKNPGSSLMMKNQDFL